MTRAEQQHREALRSLTTDERTAIRIGVVINLSTSQSQALDHIARAKAMEGHPAANLKRILEDEDAIPR